MGRKCKDIAKLKTERVNVRFTYDEMQKMLEICSKRGGITISELIRLELLREG